jgi:hypothetical protein
LLRAVPGGDQQGIAEVLEPPGDRPGDGIDPTMLTSTTPIRGAGLRAVTPYGRGETYGAGEHAAGQA